MTETIHWDHTVDAVVVGSGNGGLTAAVVASDGGTDVLVIEKSGKLGGTSASSGGGVWIPNNRYANAAGADDSLAEANAYLRHVSPVDDVRPDMLETYLVHGPRMIDYLHENTRWVRYQTLEHYPDYFPEAPGWKSGHRSMEPQPVHGSELGADFSHLQEQHLQTRMPGGINFTQVEAQLILAALPGWLKLATGLILRYLTDFPLRLKTRRDGRLTLGSAGVARLWLALKDRGVPVWRNTRMIDLVVEDGVVRGVIAERDGKRVAIRARRGVVLAAGGFERNQALRERYLPVPTKAEWSAGNLHNTGDALVAAQKAGAGVAQMDWAWWFTTAVIPGREKAHLSQVEKGLPGSITVDQRGKRFSNESQNYVTFVREMLDAQAQGKPCVPCYMIFDADFRRQRPLVAALIQSRFFPDWLGPKSWWSPTFITKADSIRALAEKIGIDEDNLEATVERFNGFAETGEDLDFQRGRSEYDRYYADAQVNPNPCLGPIRKPPFYCMTLYPGDMGTAGGLLIDANARVQAHSGVPIEGLYACGNTTAALLPNYPGPGSTLGPAMTFGYLAGRHLTGQSAVSEGIGAQDIGNTETGA